MRSSLLISSPQATLFDTPWILHLSTSSAITFARRPYHQAPSAFSFPTTTPATTTFNTTHSYQPASCEPWVSSASQTSTTPPPGGPHPISQTLCKPIQHGGSSGAFLFVALSTSVGGIPGWRGEEGRKYARGGAGVVAMIGLQMCWMSVLHMLRCRRGSSRSVYRGILMTRSGMR